MAIYDAFLYISVKMFNDLQVCHRQVIRLLSVLDPGYPAWSKRTATWILGRWWHVLSCWIIPSRNQKKSCFGRCQALHKVTSKSSRKYVFCFFLGCLDLFIKQGLLPLTPRISGFNTPSPSSPECLASFRGSRSAHWETMHCWSTQFDWNYKPSSP